MQQSNRPLTLVYITGYGRSGSSLLDLILGNHPQVFGGGELTWLFSRRMEGDTCSCACRLEECPFWSEVFDRLVIASSYAGDQAAARLTLNNERLFRRHRNRQDYLSLWTDTLNAIGDVSGKSVIIDSSKTSRLALHRVSMMGLLPNVDLKVLHLVRDPRAVMWSSRRGSNRKLEKGQSTGGNLSMLRGSCGWMFANVACEIQSRFADRQRLVVRYEDLVNEDQQALQQIAEFIGIDASPIRQLIATGSNLDCGHATGGNRMRRSGGIVLRADQDWQGRSLGVLGTALSTAFKPLRTHYGYGD